MSRFLRTCPAPRACARRPRPDALFPVAHTCFFSLELPAYTSAAICRERLLYAITHCLAIDIDTTTGARENRQLREKRALGRAQARASPLSLGLLCDGLC